jgi:hypothetical protein
MSFFEPGELLFAKRNMSDVLAARRIKLVNAIDSLPEPDLAQTLDPQRLRNFAQQFEINIPRLDERRVRTFGPRRVQTDVGAPHWRAIYGSGPAYLEAVEITYRIPFAGDEEFFFVRPNDCSLIPPRGFVRKGRLEFSFRKPELIEEQVQRELDHSLVVVKWFLGCQANDARLFNDDLYDLLSKLIVSRSRFHNIYSATAIASRLANHECPSPEGGG